MLVTEINWEMNLDDFGVVLFSIDFAAFLKRKKKYKAVVLGTSRADEQGFIIQLRTLANQDHTNYIQLLCPLGLP